jgi:hypothetical protein
MPLSMPTAVKGPARPVEEPAEAGPRRRARVPLELAGYALIALGVAAVMAVNVRNVDVFYLDEWFYTGGSRYIWDHLPGALLGEIPEWNRGPQRLYSTLLAPVNGLFGARDAFVIGHLINVALLASTVVPLALLARRVIASPWLRVLAVALGTAVPWLIIASHLLTENLAFPLFAWASYAIVVTAERPTWRNELAALAAIAALALCRLNLAAVFAVLVLAVLVDELYRYRGRDGASRGAFLRAAARRRPLVGLATIVGALGAVWLLTSGSESLGAYGGFTSSTLTDGLFGAGRSETFRTVLTYARGLVGGTFVLPVALGLAVGLAGLFGRLGRALVVPSAVALGGLLAVLVVVSLWTKGAALEERYVFYPVGLIAILAVAGVERAGRLRAWIGAGAALAFWPFIAGHAWPGQLAEHFFAAPGKAFWSRVLDARLRQWEGRLLGWTLIPPTGWLLLAVGLIALVLLVRLASRRAPLVRAVLIGGLVLCLIAQVLSLNYDFRQELYGTNNNPGGIAGNPGHSLSERPAFVDGRTGGEPTAVVPALVQSGASGGAVEQITFWNRDVDATADVRWAGAPMPVPPGGGVSPTELGEDGLARWAADPPAYVVAVPDDPRVQFPSGPRIAGFDDTWFQLRELEGDKALWSATGLQPDAALVPGGSVEMAFDRAARRSTTGVTLQLDVPKEAEGATRATIIGAGGREQERTLRAGRRTLVRLDVPPCPSSGTCEPARWTLRAKGKGAAAPLAGYGASEPRTVLLHMSAVRLGG